VGIVFSKGEAVAYPMHGAGIIEDFEQAQVDGISREYYVLCLPLGNLRILLCRDSAEFSNLRKVLCKNDIAQILLKTANEANTYNYTKADSWSVRYKENAQKIKSGEFCDTATVFYELHYREKEKGLSGSEKKLMTTVKKIILSEVMLSYDIEKSEAEELLEKYALESK
jgi:CarD family transcriptional regulator